MFSPCHNKNKKNKNKKNNPHQNLPEGRGLQVCNLACLLSSQNQHQETTLIGTFAMKQQPQNLLERRVLKVKNKLDFLDPKFFSDSKLFLDPNFYLDPNFCFGQLFLDPKFFWKTKFIFDPKIFFGPNFCNLILSNSSPKSRRQSWTRS